MSLKFLRNGFISCYRFERARLSQVAIKGSKKRRCSLTASLSPGSVRLSVVRPDKGYRHGQWRLYGSSQVHIINEVDIQRGMILHDFLNGLGDLSVGFIGV